MGARVHRLQMLHVRMFMGDSVPGSNFLEQQGRPLNA